MVGGGAEAGVGSHAYFCIIILNSHQRGMQSEETALPKGPSKCLTAVPSAQYVFHQISKLVVGGGLRDGEVNRRF